MRYPLCLTSDIFKDIVRYFTPRFFTDAEVVDVGQWQSIDIGGRPEMVTRELRNVVVDYIIRFDPYEDIQPNQPWADEHFKERVGGVPLNPPPSHKIWPYAQEGNSTFRSDGKFSHTYPERMWPKQANVGETRPNGRQAFVPHNGIRYEYGDLDDVVKLLRQSPFTRQAFLPIWFPEDTGAHHGERVPCSLGYQFVVRGTELECSYFIRSCDFRRHFADDLYLAVRLAQWVADRISEAPEDRQVATVVASRVIMHIVSFHIFEGDLRLMHQEEDQRLTQLSESFKKTYSSSSIMEALG